MKRFGIEMDDKKQKQRIIGWYSANIVAVLISIVLLYLSATFESVTKFQFYVHLWIHVLLYFETAIISSTYCSGLFRLRERFRIINNLLK